MPIAEISAWVTYHYSLVLNALPYTKAFILIHHS